MNGMANAISAQGQRNLSNSAAAVNMTQAAKNSIENHQLYTDTYFQMRATNRAAVAAEKGPPLTNEQIARIARDGAPKPITTNSFDATNGQLAWPAALTQDNFTEERNEIQKVMSQKATYGGISFNEQMEARKTIEKMFAELKTQIKDIPPSAYTAAKTFLNSLIYTLAGTQL
jgi:hypothetical protein